MSGDASGRNLQRRNVMVFENMDEILSQRSHANGSSEFGGSEASLAVPRRVSHHNRGLYRHSSSVLSSNLDWQEYSGAAGLVNPKRLSRRHSSLEGRDAEEHSSSSSSVSLDDSDMIDRRFSNARVNSSSAVPHPTGISRESIQAADSEDDENVELDRRNRFLACLGCFNTRSEFTRLKSRNPSPRSIRVPEPIAEQGPLSDPFCKEVEKIFNLLSERVEVDVLAASGDQRMVFLLFAALSGDPLLTQAEYADCDEWVDWLMLGFSSSSLDAFQRDINRHGCQAMGLTFQLFFALEYTKLAQICTVIVRNIHLDPAALFGLFAVNCCKWTRDVLLNSLRRFENRDSRPVEGPLLFTSVGNFSSSKFKSFSPVWDWWVSCGARGSMDSAEKRFSDSPRASALYSTFLDDAAAQSEDDEKEEEPEVTETHEWRIPDLNSDITMHHRVKTTVIVGSLYYTFCMLSFAKFWLQKDLISAESEAAREKLNNAYLDREFVAKLKLSASMPVAELLRNIDKLSSRVLSLWKHSGWRREDLLGRLTTRHSDDSEASFSDMARHSI